MSAVQSQQVLVLPIWHPHPEALSSPLQVSWRGVGVRPVVYTPVQLREVRGMKVLVLGGAGFIGPRVMRRLVERGHDVACMDINPSSRTLDELQGRIEVSRGDVTLMDDVMRSMIEARPDRVLNLAYWLGDDRDPHFGVRLNV